MPTELEYARVDPTAVPTRGPRTRSLGVLAALATLVLIGVGHLVVGRRRRGFGWLGVYVLLNVAIVLAALSARPEIWIAVVAMVHLAVLLACIIDAYRVGRRSTLLARLGWGTYAIVVTGVLVLMVFNPMSMIAARLLVNRPMIEAFVVPTVSMDPTLAVGDRVLVNKWRDPARWDVVAFHSSDPTHAVYLRRVVGMPGDRVEVSNGTAISINGQPMHLTAWEASVAHAPPQYRPYVPTPPRNAAQGHAIVLGADEYFLVADNFAFGTDSRFYAAYAGHSAGTVPRQSIIGTAMMRYWPLRRWGKVERLDPVSETNTP